MGQWEHGDRPYPYPFALGDDQLPGRARRDCWLPDLRRALGGTEDIGTQAWERRGRSLNARLWFDTLKRNPDRGDRRRWRMFDSFGEPLYFIEQHDEQWAMSDEDGAEIYRDRSTNREQLQLQGQGCMSDERLKGVPVYQQNPECGRIPRTGAVGRLVALHGETKRSARPRRPGPGLHQRPAGRFEIFRPPIGPNRLLGSQNSAPAARRVLASMRVPPCPWGHRKAILCCAAQTSALTVAPSGSKETRRTSQSGTSPLSVATTCPVASRCDQNSTVGPAPEIDAPTAPNSRAPSSSSIERG